ncbi:MAG: hypothetical protein ACI92E_000104, partial [Oceanicoccus sp.]
HPIEFHDKDVRSSISKREIGYSRKNTQYFLKTFYLKTFWFITFSISL